MDCSDVAGGERFGSAGDALQFHLYDPIPDKYKPDYSRLLSAKLIVPAVKNDFRVRALACQLMQAGRPRPPA